MRVLLAVLGIFCILLIGFWPATTVTANIAVAREEYTGTVVGVGGSTGGVSRPFTLTIENRSSVAEANRAIATLADVKLELSTLVTAVESFSGRLWTARRGLARFQGANREGRRFAQVSQVCG